MENQFKKSVEKEGLSVLGALKVQALTQDYPQWKDYSFLALIGMHGKNLEHLFTSEFTGLDDWTKNVVDQIAEGVSGVPIYPFEGPPFFPFVSWALKTGQFFKSPLGMTIHPEWGLWHSFRAAVLLPFELSDKSKKALEISPCDSCVEKPCLSACPVNAFQVEAYDVNACVSFLESSSGHRECMNRGCLSRLACPIGKIPYGVNQKAFHMREFLKMMQRK